jgi:hypothetical protein
MLTPELQAVRVATTMYIRDTLARLTEAAERLPRPNELDRVKRMTLGDVDDLVEMLQCLDAAETLAKVLDR